MGGRLGGIWKTDGFAELFSRANPAIRIVCLAGLSQAYQSRITQNGCGRIPDKTEQRAT